MTYLQILNWAKRGIQAEAKETEDKIEKATAIKADEIVNALNKDLAYFDRCVETIVQLECIHDQKER